MNACESVKLQEVSMDLSGLSGEDERLGVRV
jgi:hypothetical protein